MAWIKENLGRRTAGCKNYKVKSCGFFEWINLEKKPRERIHEFYWKIQELKQEIGQKNAGMKLMEKKLKIYRKRLTGRRRNECVVEE